MLSEIIADSRFKDEIWGKRPSYYKSLSKNRLKQLSVPETIEYLLEDSRVSNSIFNFYRDGKTLTSLSEGSVDSKVILQEYDRGFTGRVLGVHKKYFMLSALCSGIVRDFECDAQANLYVTAPDSSGVELHYDDHDVFVIQISGKKHWKVYEKTKEAINRPTCSKHLSSLELPEILNMSIDEGDVLYIPKGFSHVTSTSELPSIHVTIGVYRN